MTLVSYTKPDGTQEQKNISDLLGGNALTVMYFYPKDNTPGCTIQAQDFVRLYEEFEKCNVGIIGVSKDSHKSHCSFQSKCTIPYPLISDPEFILHEQYGTVGMKSMYGKSYRGTIRSTRILDSQGTIIHARDNISSSGHAQIVLDRIHTFFHQ